MLNCFESFVHWRCSQHPNVLGNNQLLRHAYCVLSYLTSKIFFSLFCIFLWLLSVIGADVKPFEKLLGVVFCHCKSPWNKMVFVWTASPIMSCYQSQWSAGSFHCLQLTAISLLIVFGINCFSNISENNI